MSIRIRLIMAVFFVGLCIHLHAQAPLEIKFNQDDGLPSNVVYRALQDSDGYMWFCTEKGLSKFDGYNFKNFTIEDGLPINDIYNIEFDHLGRLWLVTFDKICYIKDDQVYQVPFPKGYQVKGISKHYLSQDGKKHLIDFVEDTYHFLELVNDSLMLRPKEPKDQIVSINSDGMIALLNSNECYFKWGRYIDGKYNVSKTVNDCFNKGVSTKLQNVTLNDKRFYFEDDQITTIGPGGLSRISNKSLFGINEEPNFVTSTDDKILIQFDKDGYLLNSDLEILSELEFLAGAKINSFYNDADGNTWVCTSQGLNYYLNNPLSSRNYIAPGENDRLTTITKSKQGELYVVSQYGTVYTFNEKDGFQLYLSTDLNVLEKIYINEYSGEKFLGDLRTGLIKTTAINAYKKEFDQRLYTWFYQEDTPPKHYSFIKVSYKDVAFDEKGTIAISHPGGVKLVDKDSVLTISKERSYALEYIQDTLWIGTMHGIYRYDGHQLEAQTMSDRLPYISRLEADERDHLWIVTNGDGLWKYDGQAFKQISCASNLTINNIHVYNSKEVWLACQNGLYKLDWSTNDNEYTAEKYGKANGLPTESIVDVNADDSYVYALSAKVMSVLDKKGKVVSKSKDFNFTEFKINGQDVDNLDGRSLKSRQNNVGIGYKSLLLSHLGNLSYQWKMKGLNDQWTETKQTSQLFYELAPGDYTFQVRSFDSNDELIGEIQELSFRINKPWHSTYWFYFGLLACMVLSFLVYDKRKAKLSKIKAEKEAVIQKEFYELRLKAVQAQMNPHFVFNSLNSIQKYIYEKEPEEANQYIVRFAKLMRAILESTSKNFSFLRDEIDLIQMYVALEKQRFSDKFDYEINIDDRLLNADIKMPSSLIQPFVENAINHGIALKEGKAKLLIQVEAQGDELVWIVQDDGVGRKEAAKRKQSNHVSRAMKIIEERKEILRQRDQLDLDFSFVDLTDSTGHGIGTKVIIKMPLDIE